MTFCSSGGGDITLKADAIDLAGQTVDADTSDVYLLPYTSATAVSVGGSEAFDLSDTELGLITSGGITVGEDASGVRTAGAVTLVSAEDVDLVISFDSDDGAGDFMRFFYLEYDSPVIQSMIGVMVANSKVQYNAGNYAAIVPSIRGAAEYQFLANYPGYALTQMDAFSVVQFFLILLMVLGNVGYYGYTKNQRGAS